MHIKVNHTFNVEPISRESFVELARQYEKIADKFERMPSPDVHHQCTHCPIDPHTIRYVISTLMALRDHLLRRANDTSIAEPAIALLLYTQVNSVDTTIATLCGQFAPDILLRTAQVYPTRAEVLDE